MNANRFLGINAGGQAGSMEKLSSGLRINRAGDDAARLAISEKMRNQIKGLEQASRNAQDGISLIQTAEGALGETHEMLQRMRELSIQSMNDTYTDADRAKIDLEVQQLLDEIDGIADKTEFNEQRVLAGGEGVDEEVTFEASSFDPYTDTLNSQEEADALKAYAENRLTEIFTSDNTSDTAVQKQLTTMQNALDAVESFSATRSANGPTQASFDTALSTVTGGSGASFSSLTLEDRMKVHDLAVSDDPTDLEELNETNSSTGLGAYNALAALDGGSDIIADINKQFKSIEVAEAFSDSSSTKSVTANNAGAARETGTTYSSTIDFTTSMDTFTTSADVKTAMTDLIDDRIKAHSTGGNLSAEAEAASIAAAWGDVKAYLTNMEGSSWSGEVPDDYDSMSLEDKMKYYDENNGPQNTRTNSYEQGAAGSAGITAYNYLKEADSEAVEYYNSLAERAGVLIEAETEPESRFDKDIAGSRTFDFHVGANENQKISVEIQAMGVINLGLEGVDVGSKAGASASLALIDAAVEQISEQRAILGAVQNRLEHTIKNVDNTAENLQSAESNIRDTDMASEMVKLTKFNILSQASQSMLAQANQAPQQVLQLLG